MQGEERKNAIISSLEAMKRENLARIAELSDRVSIFEYEHMATSGGAGRIWTQALQAALREHEIVKIPAADAPYYIDAPVLIPSGRRIEASPGAVIRLAPQVRLLMLRSEHTKDGTHMPFGDEEQDSNISISGGRWEESNTQRAGYGKTGMYDEERSLYGVSTCMLFNNIDRLTLTDMVFAHTAAFAVQLGNVKNVVIENIRFEQGYADGIHINGNTENVLVRNISGEVGDDLVALNTYDWQNSSVNFGPGKNILCENIVAAVTGKYKSIRLEQGVYTYDDGSQVDCSLTDALIKGARGMNTFKMYYQTPRYRIGEEPEKGAPGTLDGVFFEDIDIDLNAPVDSFPEYLDSDPLRGWFGAFELGSNIGYLSLKDIRIRLYPEKFPLTRLIVVGPKSIRRGEYEIFDPYISNTVDCIELENITVNGIKADDARALVRVTEFDDINGDGHSGGKGVLKKILLKK